MRIKLEVGKQYMYKPLGHSNLKVRVEVKEVKDWWIVKWVTAVPINDHYFKEAFTDILLFCSPSDDIWRPV